MTNKRKRRISYTERTVRACVAILLCFAIMLIGMVGPTLAIDHWYFEPLCQHYAAEYEAVYWSYEGGGKLAKKHCNADYKSVNVVELGGLTAILLHNVQIFFPPAGMVLGLFAGALLWQRINALLDRLKELLHADKRR